MRINHNITALNTYGKLTSNTQATNKSLEKLSSGLAINRAGDNAAGLAISEKMRGQIRGLDQASTNANDAISMIQTAEGALNETHSILQRMRELAVQAGNDTNVDIDREEIQKEMNQLTSEINRIGNTTEFNTQKLLNGGGEVKSIDVNQSVAGAKAGAVENVDVITNSTAQVDGVYTLTTTWDAGMAAGDTLTIEGEVFTLVDSGADATHGEINIGSNETTFTSSLKNAIDQNDKLSARFDSSAAVGVLTLTEKSGMAEGAGLTVSSDLNAGTFTYAETTASVAEVRGVYEYEISKAFEDVGATVQIGGRTFTAVKSGADAEDGEFNIGSDPEKQAISLAAAINADATLGARFSATVEDGTLRLTEKLGEATGTDLANATVSSTAVQGMYSFDMTEIEAGGKITIDGVDIKVVSDSTDLGLADGTAMLKADSVEQQTENLKDAIQANNDLKDKYNVNISGDRVYLQQKTGEESLEAPVVTTNNYGEDSFQSNFQVGANTNQSMTVEINDMRSVALNISGTSASGSLVSADGSVTASLTATQDVTNGTSNTGTEYALDVSNHENATDAITIINDAIQSVSAERSKLGSYQNRLEHTINNLGASSENLTTAESRIRDVDMAKEMMNFTKNNILTQAAQSMLAQANQQPQGVLQLLQ
jgi:flagellin